MRPVGGGGGGGGRPQRPEGENFPQRPHDDRPPRQDRPPQRGGGGQGRHEPRMDPMTQRRMRDDRVYAALCHAGFFLGWWGIATTAGIWALRKDWSRSLRLAGVQAVAYQILAQFVFLIIAAVTLAVASAPGGGNSLPSPFETAGILALFQYDATQVLAFTKIGLGVIAALYMLLCLVGFEPSYPVIGFFSRLVLGIKKPKPPEEPQTKDEKPEEKKAEEKKPEPPVKTPVAAPRSEERFTPRSEERFTPKPPALAPKPEEKPVLRPLPKPPAAEPGSGEAEPE